MAVNLSFGTWLKQQRKELDITQNELAERAGCSLDMVRKVEQGSARPSRQLGELLVAAVGVAPTDRAAVVQWARTGLSEAHEIEEAPTQEQPHNGARTNSLQRSPVQAKRSLIRSEVREQPKNPYK